MVDATWYIGNRNVRDLAIHAEEYEMKRFSRCHEENLRHQMNVEALTTREKEEDCKG